MVQWGAQGKAERGFRYQQILAAYYGGLKPTRYDEPSTIRILVGSGLRTVQVEPSGTVTVSGSAVGLPPWMVTGGSRLAVGPSGPLPSYVSPSRIVKAPRSLRTGRAATVTVDVPALSVVHLAARGRGPEVSLSDPVTEQTGRQRIRIRLPAAMPGGGYRLVALTTNGTDIAASPPHRLRVDAPTPSPTPTETAAATPSVPPSPPAVAAPAASHSVPWLAIAGLGLVLFVAAGLAVMRVRRRRRSQPAAAPPSS
jgi:hypothetical protein